MLWISEHSSLRSVLARIAKPNPPPPTNRQLARPREGFAKMYAVAAAKLAERGAEIVTGVKMHGLEKLGGDFCLVLDDRTILAKRIISTIPIAGVEAYCNLPVSEKLETITLLTLYFSFSGERGFTEAILYNFSHTGAWKRLTVYRISTGATTIASISPSKSFPTISRDRSPTPKRISGATSRRTDFFWATSGWKETSSLRTPIRFTRTGPTARPPRQ